MPRGMVFRHEVVQSPEFGDSTKALTASARVYESGGPGAQSLRNNGRKSRSNSWQNESWDYYDQVPEFRAACSWVGNLLSKAVLMVYKDGKPTTNQDALDALASLFGGPEGQEEMLRLLGIHFTATGEGWVVGKPSKKPTADDEWMVVAGTEVGGESTDRIIIEGDPAPVGTLAIRLWKAHPRKSHESDCPARALLPTLSEIVRLNQVIASLADSRLKGNGILWVPSEMEIPAIPVVDLDGDIEHTSMQDVSVSEGLTRQLIRTMSIAMQNRDSAAASVPLVVAIPGEYLEKVNWTDFWTGFDEHAQKLREEARASIGVGMDMPPEALTGTGDMNHWGAWQIEEAAIKIHTEPLLAVIVSSLTTGYLHKVLKGWGVPEWETYTFEANTAALRLRPNRSKEAVELWDRGALSMRTLLIENGFDPDTDLPNQKEQITFFLRQIASKTSATPDQLAAALAGLGLTGIPGDVGEARGAIEPPRNLDRHPVQAAPDPEESEAEDAVVASAMPLSRAYILDGLLLASEAHVDRALERAGNKLKNRIGRNLSAPACELYLQAPRLDRSECEALLEDAWGALDRHDYGVNRKRLREALHEYTLSLLRLQKPHDRETLARALLLELAEDQAA